MSDTLTPVKPGRLIINGEAVDAADGATFTTINPATEEVITTVAEAGVEDVDRAVKAAHAALHGPWAKMKAIDRSRVLWKLGDLILQNADELARLETLDNGKPITESRYVDIDMVAKCFHYFSGWASKLTGDTTSVNAGTFTYTLREPVGVVGAIIPWNFPMIMVGWKVAPALAAGNTIVVKPAELTPLTAIRIAELALEAGVPAGVFNVVPGKGRIAGEALVKHPLVSKISFTGSTEVGKHLMRTAADQLKKVTLELGGKSPNLVFADCPDLDRAVEAAVNNVFFNQGESCNAPSRLFVEESIKDQFLEKALAMVPKYQPGDPLAPGTMMGAVVDRTQLDTVLGYIASGREQGARLLAGGSAVEPVAGGCYVQPTLFDGVTNDMRIAREEIFGPVLSVLSFSDAAEAVRQANDSLYGLQAAVWTRDLDKAHGVARALRAGTVHVNQYNDDDITVPFGGFRQSGVGRDKSLHAFDKYTELKTTWIKLSSPF